MSGTRQHGQRLVIKRRVFVAENRGKMGGNLARGQVFQMELQAARQHGSRHFLRIGGGENEFDVRRRFFQGFQKRIETAARKHVYLVNQIHFEAPFHRRIGHVIEQIARIVHAGARCRIHFDQIGKTAGIYFQTVLARAARMAAHAIGQTIQGFGENTGNRRFAHAARAGKKIGVMDAVVIERVGKRFCHVRLANQFVKIFRSPLPGKNLVHVRNGSKEKGLHQRSPALNITTTVASFRTWRGSRHTDAEYQCRPGAHYKEEKENDKPVFYLCTD